MLNDEYIYIDNQIMVCIFTKKNLHMLPKLKWQVICALNLREKKIQK